LIFSTNVLMAFLYFSQVPYAFIQYGAHDLYVHTGYLHKYEILEEIHGITGAYWLTPGVQILPLIGIL
ncbi:MAG: hypothetical protein AAF499_13785, partial [Pseudomonadota bacterium]